MLKIIVLLGIYLLLLSGKFVMADEVPARADTSGIDSLMKEKKIFHVEPLFFDFTTEPVAGKGKTNVNFSYCFRQYRYKFKEILSQADLEFSPLNRVGFKVSLPYRLGVYNPTTLFLMPRIVVPDIHWAAQYTMLVLPTRGITIAGNYRNCYEFKVQESMENRFKVNRICHYTYLTFAKNWNDNTFLTLYPGVEIFHLLNEGGMILRNRISAAIHKRVGRKRHFLGAELNQQYNTEDQLDLTLRPQFLFFMMDHLRIGIGSEYPLLSSTLKSSVFLRVFVQL